MRIKNSRLLFELQKNYKKFVVTVRNHKNVFLKSSFSILIK